jgi:3-oxoadipate CoA-transferase beta subunit
MDLAVGAKQVFVLMSLFTKSGESKLVEACTYPITALHCVDRVYTDVATFDLTTGDAVGVLETWGMSFDELRSRLDVPLTWAGS